MPLKNKEVAIMQPSQTPTVFTDEQLELMVEASASTGIKSKGEALMVFQKAKELGIGAANALSHIQVINGKSGIDIHIIKAILSRPSSGVTWEHIYDFKPLYMYTDGKTSYPELDLPSNHVVLNKLKDNPLAKAAIDDGKIPVVKLPTIDKKTNKRSYLPYDYISTYKFTRIRKNIKGEWETITNVSSFTWQEALQAGLPLGKDGQIAAASPWFKYKKLMLNTRAFTYGARDIASDLLLGMYETSELYDFNDKAYDIQDGKVTILDETSGDI